MKIRLLLLFLAIQNISYAQYASKHYIAPSPWQYWSFANEIVVSTTQTATVSVTLRKSDGSFITTFTVTALSPVSYRFIGTASALAQNAVGTTYSDRGLIVEATAPVLVNLRNIASDASGLNNSNIKGNASLVSFGNEGIGNAFRLGYYRSSFVGLASGNPVFSVMAIENNTTVTLNGTSLATLNAGQSRIFTASMGALLEANKPVVANVGSYGDTPQACGGNGEDGTVDQIAPIKVLGKQYIVVRGSGTAGTGANHPEQTTIVATEPGTTVQVRNYNASGQQLGTPITYNLANGGSFQSIHHGDSNNQYSSSFIIANKPVIVYSGTAVNCETDISTVLPIGGCAGTTNVSTKKFIDYAGSDLPYFAYTVIESSTEPIFLNGQNLETLSGVPRVPVGTTGFYMLRFDNNQIGNPANITITSNARLTTSIIQQGAGFSMSGFFSAFSDSPEPPTEVTSSNPCLVTLTTTAGLAPYQWYRDGILIPDAAADTLLATQTGNYSVVGTRSCGITLPSAPVYISVSSCSDLKVEKEVVSINGNQAVFEIKASNIGNTNDTNVTVTDLLPNGYQFISSTASTGTYSSTSGNWNIGNLLAGASATLTVTATINPTGNFVNTATISGTNLDTDPANNTAQAIAQISSLLFTKMAQQPSYHNLGDVIVYDLILTNTGQTILSNITIQDANADAGSVHPSTIASLLPGHSIVATASHTVTASDALAQQVTNQASAEGTNPLGEILTILSDDSATPTVGDATITPVIVLSADLVTVKTNNQTVYTPGTTTIYTISITNNGPTDATRVQVSDPLPLGITTMAWTGNGNSGTGNLIDTVALLQVGSTITYEVVVDIPEHFTGNLVNTVSVISLDVADPDPACPQCTDIDTACVPPVIQIPSDLVECDDSIADGLKKVNLSSKSNEIIGNTANLEVNYYLNATQLQLGNPIPNPQEFQMTTPFLQTIIVEVLDLLSGCKSHTALDIVINTNPIPLSLLQKTICQSNNDVYNLTDYEQEIVNSQVGITVAGFFNSLAEANAELNAIANKTTFSITTPTRTFFVRIENAFGCPTVREFQLTIIKAVSLQLEDQVLCTNENGSVTPIQIMTGFSTSEYAFKWYRDGQVLNNTGASLTVNQPGNYTVELINHIGCVGGSASATVTVSSGPESLTADVVTGYFSDNATIVAQATGNGNFVYWMDYGPEQDSGTFENVSSGMHRIHVKDAEGCGRTFTVEVTVIDYPKFFTPNGDGYNDTWNIRMPSSSNAIIFIFDRYGKLITSLRPQNTGGWDGTYNGNTLPSTDYWFTINYQENQQEKEFRAHFSLKR